MSRLAGKGKEGRAGGLARSCAYQMCRTISDLAEFKGDDFGNPTPHCFLFLRAVPSCQRQPSSPRKRVENVRVPTNLYGVDEIPHMQVVFSGLE